MEKHFSKAELVSALRATAREVFETGGMGDYYRALEASADLVEAGKPSPEIALLESVAIARSALVAQHKIARCLHSAIVLMTLPPFKRDNATVTPDGSLSFKSQTKDTAP